MIAKGLHFPNVPLVRLINADLAPHLPDCRTGERTFQLLTQVAGRAGRGETAGEVFVQTYTPFSPSIQFARHHDFAGYFEQELEFRERCDFPPFKHAILITIRCPHEARAKLSAETLRRRLKEALGPEFTLGEATPAPLEKLQGQFRFHILLRGQAIFRASAVHRAVARLARCRACERTVDAARVAPILRPADMSMRKILIIAVAWLAFITLIHAALNLHVFHSKQAAGGTDKRFRIGFLPVTCHLTCPVTDFINKQLTGESIFEPVRFNGWPELKEAYLSAYTPATFILAPMAMALREQGVPIKIVYLVHRHGSAVIV